MAFNHFENNSNHQPLSEINIIPLVDVMLVLLILFIITAPLFTHHAIKIDVPQASTQEIPEEPNKIVLAIDEKGGLFWNDEAIDDKELIKRFRKAAQKKPLPELHLRADKKTQYQRLAEIMSAAQNAGMTRLGFITQPDNN
ncbi:MAG: biopolymer transporter ExbD [Candidatus Parabeggiatoa sp. nov. 3]|nr:MAG: biopolymer transporter ExbD [Gammaproteobacteria bacterium]RKZ85315.1 MAG: biopolymer transporter ExbD [Gammaproteobacteria bacterium]HEW98985.1 biopolymer transporter ExbD [Beggiatoa sp.]